MSLLGIDQSSRYGQRVASGTKSCRGASPIVFGPRTLVRTWGTPTNLFVRTICSPGRGRVPPGLEGEYSGIPHLAKKRARCGAEKLFDVGGGFLETMEGCRVVLDPELGAALLQIGFHRRATRQGLLLIRLIFGRQGRGSLRHIMP